LPDSFEALAVIFFSVLPGAIFVYAVERKVGPWGVKASDRILRFIVLSAALFLVLLPYGYVLYRSYILNHDLADRGHFSTLHWLILIGHWLALLALFGLLPWLLGSWLGKRIEDGDERVGELFGHQMRPPRAFDYLFRDDAMYGVVRMLVLLPTGATWVAGSFSDEEPTEEELAEMAAEDTANDTAEEEDEEDEEEEEPGRPLRAYVSGYPENPEIYLPVRVGCHPATGALKFRKDGSLVTEDVGVLVSGDKIAYLEFIDG
jgi:hypothetical protein